MEKDNSVATMVKFWKDRTAPGASISEFINNNNNWFLQRKGIEPTQIPVTSWRAGSTLTVDSPCAQVFFTKVVDEELAVIILDTLFNVAQFF